MIARLLTAALVAGFLAACVASVLQMVLTTPLILQAEAVERHAGSGGSAGAFAWPALGRETSHGVIRRAHVHEVRHPPVILAHVPGVDAEAWSPAQGLSRTLFTGLASLVSGVGYALVLGALILAVGAEPGIGRTLPWAVGGFAAVSLAPALGLPPELPGMGSGGLPARQVWWLLTVCGTGLGLYLVAVVRSPLAVAAGLLAITAPHIVVAPHAAVPAESGVSPVMAAQFAARSLAIAFLFWVTLGASLGWMWERLGRTARARAA